MIFFFFLAKLLFEPLKIVEMVALLEGIADLKEVVLLDDDFCEETVEEITLLEEELEAGLGSFLMSLSLLRLDKSSCFECEDSVDLFETPPVPLVS